MAAIVALAAFAVSEQTQTASGGPPGAIHTVDTTLDADDAMDTFCSLREAIIAGTGVYNDCVPLASFDKAIHFQIPGCPPACTINVTSPLPTVDESDLTIDGTTQPGYVGTPLVTIDGTALAFGTGLVLLADNITVKALIVQNFPNMGVQAGTSPEYDGRRVEASIVRDNGGAGIEFNGNDAAVIDSTLEGNGENGVGANVAGAGTGLLVDGNQITGNQGDGVTFSFVDTTITNNVISGNAGSGTQPAGGSGGTFTATGNTVNNNGERGLFAGGDQNEVSNNTVIGNGRTGIIASGPGNVTGNTITGNGFGPVAASGGPEPGLELSGGPGAVVTGNHITGNAGAGITVFSSGHVIGGVNEPDANTITNNGGGGVFMDLEPDEQGNTVIGNSIHGNTGLGIDIVPTGVNGIDPMDGDMGANGLQNYPLLASATAGSAMVAGELNSNPSTEFRLEFFHNTSCDPSGFGEGQTLIGAFPITTNSSGIAEFDATFDLAPSTGFVTSTATNMATDDTSEFSNCVPILPAATPTPTPSPSPTATPTATPTPTPTATPTPTGQPTPTSEPTPTSSPGEFTWGDHNCSGPPPNAVDSLLTLRHDAGLGADTGDCPEFGTALPAGGPQLLWGDVDCDGTIGAVDALKILRFDAGLSVQQEEGCPEIGDEVTGG
jgi:CSLREA domain-containing protein